MSFIVFYSWQSETNAKYNRSFIETCLKEAVKRLKAEYKDESAEVILDRDTKDVPGFPNIPLTIEDKIKACDVFIGDLTFVEQGTRARINENVMFELGGATYTLGGSSIINVMNVGYGVPGTAMPFDISQRRNPIQYHYLEATTAEEKKIIKDSLIHTLYGAIKVVFDTKQERQKEGMKPFLTWNSWDSTFNQKLAYESSEHLETIFSTIREGLKSNSSLRLLGLSGLGKTNLMLQYFRPSEVMAPAQTAKVLYADLNDKTQADVLEKITSLFLAEKDNIIVLDNCSLVFHTKVANLLSNAGCKLRLISISPEPDESKQLIDVAGNTLPVKLLSKDFKPIVMNLLEKNFPELTQEDRQLIVEYSNGLPFFAVLMAENPEATKIKPGTLTSENILNKVLGALYADPENRKILMACAIFSKFGNLDHLAYQKDAIALCADLCGISQTDPELRVRKFKEVCQMMQDRGLLEKVGFSLTFRPTPLALKLAELWWEECTTAKFERIVEVLGENKLVESFCQQFRMLTHVEYAQEIVGKLCQGVFSTAEVLNTEVGSRLFRSFVNVNPAACLHALQTAFSDKSTEELMAITEGRRNLIWALEQLCFRTQTFVPSIKILAAFAVAENENITNNALGQFLQLFHIRLPGTMASLAERWKIIEYLLDKGGDFKTLGLRAARRALKSDQFTRMINSDEPKSDHPLDYEPNYSEVGNYWSNALELLNAEVMANTSFKENAIESILNAIHGFVDQGLGPLIVPVVEQLYDTGHLEWPKLRSKIQFTTNHKQIFDTDSVQALEKLLEKVTPETFEARFQIYVREPSSDDYFRDRKGDRDFLDQQAEKLADEFTRDPGNWAEYMKDFVSGQISEGLSFGNKIGVKITDIGQEQQFVDQFLIYLREAPPETRNIVVLIGYLNSQGIDKRKKAIEIFHLINRDENLYTLSFTLAQRIELPYADLEILIRQSKDGKFPANAFLAFKYGWGIKHLPVEQVVSFFNELIAIDEQSKAVAFSIAYTWSYNNDEAWTTLSSVIKFLITHYAFSIIDFLDDSSGGYALSESVVKLLDGNKDAEFATIVSHLVVELLNRDQGYYRIDNQLYRMCEILINQYFDVFWDVFKVIFTDGAKYDAAIDHTASLLGSAYDYSRRTPGLLFNGEARNQDVIFNWAKTLRSEEVIRFARIIPLHNQNNDQNWHGLALKFIDEFGDDKRFLEEVSAKLGSYSWVNSVVPKLRVEKAMFTELLGHGNPKVKDWAKANVDYLERRIEWENNSDAEDAFRFKG
ncbi:MAG: hypothetical protein EOO45_03420 [Flavobacterium sp.]|nr:MAG: hypothetical protein EOO45_03420 [Flavobacterium sp.]